MSLRDELQALPECAWSNSSVSFRPIKTEADLVWAAWECQLKEEQKDLVNPAWFSIGRAYLFPESYYPCIISNSYGESVGFISFGKWRGSGDAYTWSYYLHRDHQGKGLGKEAALLAVRILKSIGGVKPIKLAAEVSNIKARELYLSLGFALSSEVDGEDLVFQL